jgi:phosphate acetyltransferase
MSFKARVLESVRSVPGTLVFPEGDDDRIRQAVSTLVEDGLLDEVLVLGTSDPFDHPSVNIFDMETSEGSDDVKKLIESELDDASDSERDEALRDPLFLGAALVKLGHANGMVAGAENPTAGVLRAALNILGTLPGQNVVSSSFIMELDDKSYGSNGLMVFSDPAVLPEPDSEELVDVAAGAVGTHQSLVDNGPPRVAFLSFSTHGSASHELVDKVRNASERFADQYPDIPSDGELQADAAITQSVAERKAPDSPVAGRANVLVFPDLDAANIGYKLVQWLGGASAYGPFLQGLNGVVNDLSRGCSVEDVITVASVSLLQSAKEG